MSSKAPFITVVIPTFNNERYIRAAIDSVLGQHHGTFEIIIVDDGSTDQTRAIVERYGPLARYIYQGNAGPSTARNRGIELATAQWIAFLDADDVWNQEKCAVQMAYLNERPALVGCASHVQNFLADDGAISSEARTPPHMQQTVVTLGSTLVVRRSVFESVGMLNPEYWHRDLHDLMVRAEDRGFRIEILPDVLARRRIHASNMSNHRSGADSLELIAITRARHARRRAAGA